ncbi:MAG: SusE domain-containing protein [Chitinophagaceae bacterium]|nr:SusE domain-containing protein [Chitinophagaceae bacterium]
MKQLTKLLFLAAIVSIGFGACKKEENQIFSQSSTPPVLTATKTTMVLNINEKDNPAFTLNWTNPNYTFTTGLSSQDVNYTIQIDKSGSNFSSAALQEIAITKDLSKTFTVKEFNTLVAKMNIPENVATPLNVRVKAFLGNNSLVVYSNILNITVTGYLDVVYPVPANLFIVGSATPGGWNNPVPVPSQQLTKVGSTTFTITLPLNGGQSYLLLPVNGDWGAKYGCMGGNNSNNPNGDDFRPGGGDILAPAVSKTYTLTLEFKTGKFTVQ